MVELSQETLANISNIIDNGAPNAPSTATEAGVEQANKSPTDPQVEEPAKDETDWGKNFRALTKKEKAIREKEISLKEKESKIAESEKHWNEVNTLLQSDPLSGLEKLGVDYNHLTSLIVRKTLGGDNKTLSTEDIDSLVDERLSKKEQQKLEESIKAKEEAVTNQLSEDRTYIADLVTTHETEFPYLTLLTDLRGGDSVAQAIQDFMFEKYEESGRKSVIGYQEALAEVEKAAKAKFGPSFEKRFGIKYNPTDSGQNESSKQAISQSNSEPQAKTTSGSKTLTNQLSTQATTKQSLSKQDKIKRIKEAGW